MELRELAEQILFATTLEEKLRCPEVITDDRPGVALAAPAAPGRPPELHFKGPGSKSSDFPGVPRLEQERERGRLLHFFANHELLATELMALVLLRFPDAPAAFRRGVWQTLRDEQMHTRLYVERMRACGITFGELPVSGYFWRAVAPMANPMDYVAGLSLTFEQANLDFCRHFARGFNTVGDAVTGALFERIYRDEIAHVACGLKWFRRWKNPNESDWAAFCRQLKFPLSPHRAKGLSWNAEGRRAAGLDAQFIAELNVYSQSRGRAPSVFVFNPFAEGYIARGKSFSPVKFQTALARDLANLPQFLCRQDDMVLVPRRPSVEFLGGLKQAGFELPEFVEWKHAPSDAIARLGQRKVGRLRPWAWGPDSLELFTPLFGRVTGEARTPVQRFHPGLAQLYSKVWSAEFLKKWLRQLGQSDANDRAVVDRSSESAAPHRWLCTEREVGVAVATLEAALDVVAAIRRTGHHRIVVKEALGLAGHNAIRLWEPDVLESQRRWMARALEGSRRLVVEPWLERALDFSVQLEMTGEGLKLCGFTGLITDGQGQFQGNWAAPNHARRLPANVSMQFREPGDMVGRLHRLYPSIMASLEDELRRVEYLGPIGIDAFVFHAADGGCRLKPIVEINPRYTMGRLTVELMKRVGQGSYALLRLVTRAQARDEGCESFVEYARTLTERFPLRFEGEPVPKIREGALCLNDPAESEVNLAVLQVSRTPQVPSEGP